MKLKVIAILAAVVVALAISCQSDEQVEFQRYYSAGSLAYASHCQNCHGVKGEGLQGLIPPLTDTIYIKNSKNNLACFLKNGLHGKITVAGRDYEERMPQSGLAPIEIADILTYVVNSFGNKAGMVNVDKVGEDLNNCK